MCIMLHKVILPVAINKWSLLKQRFIAWRICVLIKMSEVAPSLPGTADKLKFTDKELNTLVDNIAKLGDQLFGAQTSPADKDKIWEDIQKQLNAVGGKKMSIEEIKRAWKNLKKQTKKKIDHNKTQKLLESKGQTANLLELTPIEQRVEVVLQNKQIFTEDFQEELDEGKTHSKTSYCATYICFKIHTFTP